MLQEAREGCHILQKLDGGDVCPIDEWVCLLHLWDFNPKFTQALSGVIVPYGVCMVGEVQTVSYTHLTLPTSDLV